MTARETVTSLEQSRPTDLVLQRTSSSDLHISTCNRQPQKRGFPVILSFP